MKNLKIGFIGISSWLLIGEQNRKIYRDSKEFLSKLAEPHEVLFGEDVFLDTVEGQENLNNLIEKWENTRLDLIIIQSVSFGLGRGPVSLAMSQKNVPIILWALPEPELKEGDTLKMNSWCGVNMHSSHLNKLGIKFEYIYGLPNYEISLKLKELIKVFEVIKKLSKSTIGALGARVPGYYDSNFDELSLRKALGVKFEFFDLAQIFKDFDKISKKEVEMVASKIYTKNKINVDKYIENSTKLYISIKRIIEEYNLSALSVKCWPEIAEILKIVPCSVVSALGDDYIPTACEGDMLGAASMLILHYFNNDVTSLMDITDFDFDKNNFLIYHCGSCPVKMAANTSDVEHKEQSLDVNHSGIANEFVLKPGKCGILRLSEDNIYKGKYRMFFAEGEGLKGPNLIRGNALKIKLDVDVNKFIETIVGYGFEHHWAFGYNINKDILSKFCNWTNVEMFFV